MYIRKYYGKTDSDSRYYLYLVWAESALGSGISTTKTVVQNDSEDVRNRAKRLAR